MKKFILSFLILLFFLTPVFARDREQLQHDLINYMLLDSPSRFEEKLKATPGLVDQNFLKLCEERGYFAINKGNHQQAYYLAYIADLAAPMIKAPANYRLGLSAYYLKTGDFTRSLDICNALEKMNKSTAIIKMIKGIDYINLANTDKAMECFQEALAIDPKAFDAHFQMGLIYKKQNNISKAKEEFQISLGLNPRLKEAQEELDILNGKTKPQEQTLSAPKQETDPLKEAESLMNQNQAANAKKVTEDYLAKNPSSFDALILITKISMQFGENDKALEYIKKATKINPSSAECYYLTGFIYEKIYDSSKTKNPFDLITAKDNYERSYKLDPDYVYAIEAVKRIDIKINQK